jgi:hypothetical protein
LYNTAGWKCTTQKPTKKEGEDLAMAGERASQQAKEEEEEEEEDPAMAERGKRPLEPEDKTPKSKRRAD